MQGLKQFLEQIDVFAHCTTSKHFGHQIIDAFKKQSDLDAKIHEFSASYRHGFGFTRFHVENTKRKIRGWFSGLVTEMTLSRDKLAVVMYDEKGRHKRTFPLEYLVELYIISAPHDKIFVIENGKLVMQARIIPTSVHGGTLNEAGPTLTKNQSGTPAD